MKHLAWLLFLLASCGPLRSYGPPLTELGTVYDVAFVPAGHGYGTSTVLTPGGGIGVGSTSVHIPARYAVVFQCQHGRFVIEGAALYAKLTRGEEVTIYYREVIEHRQDGDVVVDLDFVDATPLHRTDWTGDH